MHSYGIKCDRANVEQWLDEGKLKGKISKETYMIEEEDVYNFLDFYRWEGTAYERGIDDKTKISRLLDEIKYLKQQVDELEEENTKLMSQLDILPY